MRWHGGWYGYERHETPEERRQREIRSLELQIVDREREIARLRERLDGIRGGTT